MHDNSGFHLRGEAQQKSCSLSCASLKTNHAFHSQSQYIYQIKMLLGKLRGSTGGKLPLCSSPPPDETLQLEFKPRQCFSADALELNMQHNNRKHLVTGVVSGNLSFHPQGTRSYTVKTK